MAIEGLEILMSRLDGLQRLMHTQKVESDLLAGLDGDLPKLLIYFEQGDAQLTCVPMDEDGSMAHFTLDLSAELALHGVSYVKRQTICDLFNRISMAGMAFLSEQEDGIFYRWVLPEAELPTSDETFLYFVSLFAEYLGRLNDFAAQVSAIDDASLGGQAGAAVKDLP